ncbi:MAG: nucleoside monophosphate kinase [Candidatus Paceibacterota bacterium]
MDTNPLIIILLGKSGAGKGTQVHLLKEKYKLEKIGSGELLRERKKIEDFTGKKISAVIDNGGIIPTPVVFKLWMQKMEEQKQQADFNGLIFDGSPRKIREAYLMDDALAWYEWEKNIKVILIDIADEDVIKRIACRRVCGNGACDFIPNSAEALELSECPSCGTKLENRPEDSPEGVQKRLAWFKEEVEPVINYYKEQDRLIVINGNQAVEKVFEDIVKAIG